MPCTQQQPLQTLFCAPALSYPCSAPRVFLVSCCSEIASPAHASRPCRPPVGVSLHPNNMRTPASPNHISPSIFSSSLHSHMPSHLSPPKCPAGPTDPTAAMPPAAVLPASGLFLLFTLTHLALSHCPRTPCFHSELNCSRATRPRRSTTTHVRCRPPGVRHARRHAGRHLLLPKPFAKPLYVFLPRFSLPLSHSSFPIPSTCCCNVSTVTTAAVAARRRRCRRWW